MGLGEKIRVYLQENGIQKQWFASRIGVSHTYLYQVLQEKKPLPSKCRKAVVKVTGGKITFKDVIEDVFSDDEEVDVQQDTKTKKCEVTFKGLDANT